MFCAHVLLSDFNDEEQDFIGGLLQVDLTRRLGNMVGGTDDIKSHKYFETINWDSLLAQTIISPYIPKVTGPGDASNFDVYPEEAVTWYGTDADEYGDTFAFF